MTNSASASTEDALREELQHTAEQLADARHRLETLAQATEADFDQLALQASKRLADQKEELAEMARHLDGAGAVPGGRSDDGGADRPNAEEEEALTLPLQRRAFEAEAEVRVRPEGGVWRCTARTGGGGFWRIPTRNTRNRHPEIARDAAQ